MTKSSKGGAKHQAIISAARELFYRKGYEATSFTDIADSVGILRGNFYYYFRTKDEILAAVLADRGDELAAMLDTIDREAAPGRARLINYLDRFEQNKEVRLLYGCMMGSLAMELAKGDRKRAALPIPIFTMTLDWLEAQFSHERGHEEPRVLAVETLCRIQGAALLGSVLNDAELRSRQFEIIKDWVSKACPASSSVTRVGAVRRKETGTSGGTKRVGRRSASHPDLVLPPR